MRGAPIVIALAVVVFGLAISQILGLRLARQAAAARASGAARSGHRT
jgi:hypothetical protein